MKFEKKFNIQEAFLELYPNHNTDKCRISDKENRLEIEYSMCKWMNIAVDMRIVKTDDRGDFVIYEGLQPFCQEDFNTIIVPLLTHDHRDDSKNIVIKRNEDIVYYGPRNPKVDAIVNPSKETLDRVNNFLTDQEIRYFKN